MICGKIRAIDDVAAWQLCCGCGACSYVCPARIEMIDTLEGGRRPRFKAGSSPGPQDQEAMDVCPGIGFACDFAPDTPGLMQGFLPAWGPILEVWEGYAGDPEIRYEGASGGVATALSLYAIERGGMHGALHIQAQEDVPFLNRTVLSTTRAALLAGAGSRYAPASPCDGLKMIEDSPQPCVFVGKPCDVAAVHKAVSVRPQLQRKIGVSIAFFCAGTPTTQGTLKMLEVMGVDDPSKVMDLRYRGRGWPGLTAARFSHNGRVETRQLTYAQSWGEVLQKYRQWRCYVCGDHTGIFADIAVADAWHRPLDQGQPGLSVVLARTERGRSILRDAREAGYLVLEKSGPEILPVCRTGHVPSMGDLWGRLAMLRGMGVPAPRYEGMDLFRMWRQELGLKAKAKSLASTLKRVFRKRLYRRHPVSPLSMQTGLAVCRDDSEQRLLTVIERSTHER